MDELPPHKQRILIVDDERSLAELYRQRLIAEGYEVIYCDNGDKALEVSRTFRPDLIVLDLMMPHLNGFDAIDLFRGAMETSASHILILSALSQPEDVERAKKLGADEYIIKSDVTIEEIVQRIKSALGGSSSSDSASNPSPVV